MGLAGLRQGGQTGRRAGGRLNRRLTWRSRDGAGGTEERWKTARLPACPPARLQPALQSEYTSSSTSAPCPFGFTLRKIFAIRPLASMTNVVRRIPLYFRPYMLFS